MHMGPVELSVSDLERSLEYWQNEIGLQILARQDGRASLGVNRELVRLVEEPGARSARGHAGLYHVALLLPARRDLANWLAHAGRDQVGLEGLSDHAVSEAIYLRDPDHHGIEIYADRPRELWDGRVRELMTTMPLDVDDLLTLDDGSFDGLADGTTMGHVHLSVADVGTSAGFYRDLGFDVMAQLGDQAVFLATDGYHHHLGANTWQSRGAPYAPDDRARLTQVTIHGAPEERALRDPSGIPLQLVTAA